MIDVVQNVISGLAQHGITPTPRAKREKREVFIVSEPVALEVAQAAYKFILDRCSERQFVINNLPNHRLKESDHIGDFFHKHNCDMSFTFHGISVFADQAVDFYQLSGEPVKFQDIEGAFDVCHRAYFDHCTAFPGDKFRDHDVNPLAEYAVKVLRAELMEFVAQTQDTASFDLDRLSEATKEVLHVARAYSGLNRIAAVDKVISDFYPVSDASAAEIA